MFFYKGIRIRKLHLHEYFLWQFLFFLPFLIGLGAYGYFSIYPLVMKELEKGSISDWQVFLLPVSISVSLLCLGLVFVFLFSRFLNSRENSLFTRASQRKQLANMIVQQKFYFEKKNQKGTKIKFHKIYYRKRKGNIISVYFPLDGNKDQKKFVDMGGQLEGMFFGDHMGTISHKGFLEYQIFTNVLESRISVRDVVGKKNIIRYGKGLEWDFNSFPHLLISGGTGGGKSFALLSLMLGMLQVGEVEICDPKEIDLFALGRLPVFKGKVYTGKAIIGCLRRGQEEMVRRFRFMQESSNFEWGKIILIMG